MDWKGKHSEISSEAYLLKETLHIHPIYNLIPPRYSNVTGAFQNNIKQK